MNLQVRMNTLTSHVTIHTIMAWSMTTCVHMLRDIALVHVTQCDRIRSDIVLCCFFLCCCRLRWSLVFRHTRRTYILLIILLRNLITNCVSVFIVFYVFVYVHTTRSTVVVCHRTGMSTLCMSTLRSRPWWYAILWIYINSNTQTSVFGIPEW